MNALDLPSTASFGFSEAADFRAVDVEEAPLSISFTLLANNESHPVRLAVPGRHNVANALAALAAADALGIATGSAVAAIGSVQRPRPPL